MARPRRGAAPWLGGGRPDTDGPRVVLGGSALPWTPSYPVQTGRAPIAAARVPARHRPSLEVPNLDRAVNLRGAPTCEAAHADHAVCLRLKVRSDAHQLDGLRVAPRIFP
eukprot:CAMPEP_0180394272 /NCGR_PEP_ID=MMETSP0989-20121125/34199_1 /TAXON_ID=697907 /ORGANISM="non described non described, Strain CCMP2293" /LENGTH=109 /DNA_ID=CAMNT_0022396221 /DNA_START=235 /DNA_END=565 /DNA_ORIENTATION=-